MLLSVIISPQFDEDSTVELTGWTSTKSPVLRLGEVVVLMLECDSLLFQRNYVPSVIIGLQAVVFDDMYGIRLFFFDLRDSQGSEDNDPIPTHLDTKYL